jgi:hypothetical protein
MPVLALVPSGSIIRLEVGRDLARGRQQTVFFGVERFVAFGQHPADLAGGNRDPQFAELLEQQRFGDLIVVILVQDKGSQRGTEVTAEVIR